MVAHLLLDIVQSLVYFCVDGLIEAVHLGLQRVDLAQALLDHFEVRFKELYETTLVPLR